MEQLKNQKKKNKKKHPGRAQSDALTLKSIGVEAKKKFGEKKHKYKHKNGNNNNDNNGYVSGLKMNSLIKLNGMQLNESYESNMNTENLFIEHMTLSECQILAVNDNIDFRSDNGYVFGAAIIDKVGPELTVEFKNNMGEMTKIKSNYNKEVWRFAKYLTISKRISHRMLNLQVGNTVDVNPKRKIMNQDDNKNDNESEWIVGEVIQKDFKSGQCQIEYSYNNEKYLYWVHTDNFDEIAPYLTHYDMTVIMDTYLDPIRSDQEEENRNYYAWTYEDVINWLNNIENGKFEHDTKYNKIKDGIKEFNIDYKSLSNVNDLTLRMLGVDDENDRKLIMKEVNKIIGTENKKKQREMELIRLKQEIFLQKEEIEALKAKQKKRPKGINTSLTNGVKSHKSLSNGNSLKNVSQTPKSKKSKSSLAIRKSNKKMKFRKHSDEKMPFGSPKLKNATSAPVKLNGYNNIKVLASLDSFVEAHEQKKTKKKYGTLSDDELIDDILD